MFLTLIGCSPGATNDSFVLKPSTLGKGDIMAMGRAYVGCLRNKL